MDEQLSDNSRNGRPACVYAYQRDGISERFEAPTVRELMEIVEATTDHNLKLLTTDDDQSAEGAA